MGNGVGTGMEICMKSYIGIVKLIFDTVKNWRLI